jgi:pyroglutamyl-peptidase
MASRTPSILIFSFEPFGRWKTNASTIVAQKVIEDGQLMHLRHHILPVCFDTAALPLIKEIKKDKPDFVLGLGLHGKAKCLYLERIALNIKHSTRFDAAGKKPKDSPIDPQGPPAYWTTLPYKTILESLREESIPLRLSFHAGTYICNNVLFMILNSLAMASLPTRAGFIHVPPIKTQRKGKRSLAYLSMALGRILAILQSPSGTS